LNSKQEKSILERHKSEESFHNNKYTHVKTSPGHYAVNPTYRIFQRIKERIRNNNADTVLEYGCGTGWITVELASMGFNVYAFDISSEAIHCTKKLLLKKSLEKVCNLRTMGAERLDYPENTFDIVVGFAILHHLDLQMAIPELHRVLKPGGVAYFAEPLGYNPIINFYRMLTPKFRTHDEKPIIFEEFSKYAHNFRSIDHEEFYLFALLPFVLLYIPVLKKMYRKANNVCIKIDEKLLRRHPSLGKWAWYSILKMTK